MLFYPSNPEILRTIFAVPNVALMNVMASRVFRNTILFRTSNETETRLSTIEFREDLLTIPLWEGELVRVVGS